MEYAGSYRLEACLGSGGMGVVHLARSASGLRLAVKVVHQQYAADPEFRARFRQEVAAARRVSGAFTAPVVDADPDAERPWMATSYIPGPTLAEQVKTNGPLSPAELRRLTAGLAEALRDIHRAGVVHRDLKPGNVLLTDNGPKVIDFGISRPVDSELRTETGKLIGSPPYMAPEQFQRPREVGPAADVFALGSLLVHAATGRGPFDSDSPYIVAYQVVHDEADLVGLPDDLVPLVGRCLAKEPEKRPTPDEIMSELLPPSYEADAFIPSQRRSLERPLTVTADPERTHVGARSTATTGVGADAARDTAPGAGNGGTGGSDGPGAAGDRRRPLGRFKWPALAVGVVVLVYGGLWAAQGFGDARDPAARPGGNAADPSGAAFTPWRTPSLGDGATAGAAPACSYTPGASGVPATLLCSSGGIAAARLDPADGRMLWSRDAESGKGTESGDGGVSTEDGESASVPVVSGGLVHTVLTSAKGARLRAYEKDDGTPAWTVDVSAGQGGVHHAGDTVLVVKGGGRVEALNGATGKRRWERELAGHTYPVLTLHSTETGHTYATESSDDGHTTLVSAVAPQTGQLAWQRRLDGNLTPVATEHGALFLTSLDAESMTDAVVRYDPGSGEVRRTALPYSLPDAQVAVRGDTAYLLARGGTLLALDVTAGRRTGESGAGDGGGEGGGTGDGGAGRDGGGDGRSPEVRWELETDVARASRPVVTAGDRLYFSAADGQLFTVDTADGAVIGRTKPRLLSGRLAYMSTLPAPVTAPGRVYAGAPDGSVFAVDSENPDTW
ncbi:serine/threonine-protein kinase [Streptomyces sp. NBC_01498]|uniref:serine/threonine-protein kinase n=1 Tax=Streptomyces sp. NBC_01498 TaxID=2975870 RepID=UPI002E7C0AFF|nr:serine/threonine-protein kinase [Streptomyces sp. NBC_01498]WTL25375.1 serine/threonine-protein kinase [Streptomyces sp. NBC_01498]